MPNRPIILVFCLFLLGACDLFYVGSTATVITTDKTITDHAVSFASGKDCSTIRLERGQSFCKEDEVNPEPTVHCFGTIGGVDCYKVANDPYGERQRVGRNDHNVIGR